jgi:hypothetical protein
MSNAVTIPAPITALVDTAKGWPVAPTNDPNTPGPVIVAPESWEACITPDMFVVEWRNTGARSFARFTGRTRKFWGYACPTVTLFDITTVVEMRGEKPVIMAGIGAERPGTWFIRPEAVKFL